LQKNEKVETFPIKLK